MTVIAMSTAAMPSRAEEGFGTASLAMTRVRQIG
jgi:hypothetical protein